MNLPGSLGQVIRQAKWRHRDSERRGDHDDSVEDYADLGEADLPPHASVHLADMTGRPVEDFEYDGDEYPIPDFEDLEVLQQ